MRGYVLLTGLLIFSYCGYGFELKTFRIPTHTVNSLRASADGTLYNNGFTDRLSGDKTLSGYARIGSSGYFLYDSEAFAVETWATTEFEGSTGSSKRRGPNYDGDYERYESGYSSTGQTYLGELRSTYFPTALPIGISLGGYFETQASQRWRHSDSFLDTDTSEVTSLYDVTENRITHYVSGEFEIGWGRLRDASGAYKAYVVEQRLKDMGRLSGELSAETRQKLGELFYSKPDYETRWERGDRRFWNDVEAILKSDKAVTGPLDAYALYRINETVAPATLSRWSGTRIGVTAGGMHRNYINKYALKSRSHTVPDAGEPIDSLVALGTDAAEHSERSGLGLKLESNIPLSWTLQFTGNSEITHSLDPANDGFFWYTDLTIEYAVHDRWRTSYTLNHSREINDPKERGQLNGQGWSIGHMARLVYYAEDKLRFSVLVYQNQNYEWDYRPNDPNQPRYSRQYTNFQVSFGLTYIISGSRSAGMTRYLPRTHDSSGDWVNPYFW